MKRLLAAAVATAAAASLTLTTVPAQAAAKPGVLSAKDVRSAYGLAVKGKIKRYDGIKITTSCTGTKKIRTKRARSVDYKSVSKTAYSSPVLSVTTGAYQAKSVASAKKIMKSTIRTANCVKAEFASIPGVTITRIKVPKVGAQRHGYLVRVPMPQGKALTVTVAAVRKKSTAVLYAAVYNGEVKTAANNKLIKKAVRKA